ncbi:MAG: glycosyltransferase family 4 protein [Planctomycetales bacterium]|nr:glycosyltransferase family 4 protein [Planctomycetales bacterium]
MNILIAHNDYGRPSGEEHAIDSTAQLLQSRGHQITWLRESSARLMNKNAGHLRAFFSGIHSSESRRRIQQLLGDRTVDVMHVQNLFPFLSPSILKPARDRGLPIVMRCPNYRLFCPSGLQLCHGAICERCLGGREWWCAIRNCESNRWKSLGYAARNAFARVTGSITKNVHLFVVLSEFQRERFIAGGIPPDRIMILHNFVDDLPDAAHVHTGGIGSTIAFMGRPAVEKGIRQFLEAARRLPTIPFEVAGDPASMPRELLQRLPSNVTLCGFLKGADFDRFCQRARIVTAPCQWYEGFPNILVRAMAFEKPVVASRIGAIPEIVIDNETGYLHDPANVDELVAVLQRLYDDADTCQAMGRCGRQRAASRYDRDSFYQQLMCIYRRASEIVANS